MKLNTDLTRRDKSAAAPDARHARPQGHGDIVLSACLIVRDEEIRLPRCLKTLQPYCDEIVVVDTGSQDRTVQVAIEHGAKVFTHPWNGDFSSARNAALDHASGRWVLIIDADEQLVIPPDSPICDPAEFRRWLSLTPFDAFMVPIHNLTDSGESYVIHYERLFRRHPDVRFEGRIHEQVAPALQRRGARIALAPIEIHHDGYLSRIRQERNKSQRNLELLTRAVLDEPDNWYLRLKLAEEYHGAGALHEAVVESRKALDLCPEGHPLFERCLTVAAQALVSARRFDEALALFQRYRFHHRLTAQSYYAWGRVLQAAGRRQDALAMLYKAIAYGDPGPKSVIRIPGVGSYLAWTAVGHIYRDVGDAARAVAAYREALKARPNHPEAAQALVQVLATYGEPDEAIRQEIARCDLSDGHTAAAVIQGLLVGGRAELASALFGADGAPSLAVAEDKPIDKGQAQRLFWLGIVHANSGRFQQAVDCFNRLEEDPSLADPARMEQAFCLMMMGELQRATELASQALLSPSVSANAEMLLHLLSARQGLPQPPPPLTTPRGSALVQFFYRFARLRDWEHFKLCEQVAASMGLEQPQRAALLGRILIECGWEEKGVPYLIEAAREGSTESVVYGLLAEHALRQGLAEDAAVLARRAASLDGANPRWARLLVHCQALAQSGVDSRPESP